MTSGVLCALDEISDPGARGFVFGGGAKRFDIFVVRRGDMVKGYVNRCPHRGTPLETFPDRFLTESGDLIVCSTHGACFRLHDGLCVEGPCIGRHLRPVEIEVADGMVRLAGGEPQILYNDDGLNAGEPAGETDE